MTDIGPVQIEDRLGEYKKKQEKKLVRKNSKAMGTAFELRMRKRLSEAWGRPFTKVLESGRHKGIARDAEAAALFCSDLYCSGFLFQVEAKYGRSEIDLVSLFVDNACEINEWIKQATEDAEKAGKKPLLIWQKQNKPVLCAIDLETFDSLSEWLGAVDPVLAYRGFAWFALEHLERVPEKALFLNR